MVFRRAYDALCERSQKWADLEYIRILHLAATTMQCEVEAALVAMLEAGEVPESDAVKARIGACQRRRVRTYRCTCRTWPPTTRCSRAKRCRHEHRDAGAAAQGLPAAFVPRPLCATGRPGGKGGWSHTHYLDELAAVEAVERAERRIARLLSESKLARDKTMATLDTGRFPTPVRTQIARLVEGQFVQGATNLRVRQSGHRQVPCGLGARSRAGTPGPLGALHPGLGPGRTPPRSEARPSPEPGAAPARPYRVLDPGRHRLRAARPRRGWRCCSPCSPNATSGAASRSPPIWCSPSGTRSSRTR